MRRFRALIAAALIAAFCLSPSVHWPAAEAGTNTGQATSTFQRYYQHGQSLATLGQDSAFLWQDFMSDTTALAAGNEWLAGLVGSASVTSPSGLRGGIFRFSTGATANSLVNYRSGGNIINGPRAERWAQIWRCRVQTAIDAQTIAAVGIWGETGNLTAAFGVFGAQSTVNFQLQFDGTLNTTFVSTGLAIDTNFHVIELYGRSDNIIRLKIDGGAEISGTASVLGADQYNPYATIRNGTTATNRNLDCDYSLTIAGRS